MSERFRPSTWEGGKRSVRAYGGGSGESSEPDATDAAKALAAEHGIALADIEGTGANGRIVVGDVEALIPAEPVADDPGAEGEMGEPGEPEPTPEPEPEPEPEPTPEPEPEPQPEPEPEAPAPEPEPEGEQTEAVSD